VGNVKALVLVGFMGAGKTTVGKLLAGKLSLKFVDTDELIENKAGMPVSEIFETCGEDRFRDMETEVLKDVVLKGDAIVSSGGGIVIREDNRKVLKNGAFVVYLKADATEILSRVSGERGKRPLLNVDDPQAEIERLLKTRQPLYENVSDIIVDTTNMDIIKITELIIYEATNHGFISNRSREK
jgi:shikimate kinase